MDAFAASAFWLAIAWLAYIYGGFVLLVAAVGWFRQRAVRTGPATPPATLVIAAFNEEAVIGERIENALAMDYPAGQLDVLVAADGCTDATEDIVRRYGPRGVRLVSLPRLGKIRALNAAVEHARGEILVFSDANVMCRPDALRAMARSFADPSVGGVAGRTVYRLEARGESNGRGERLYWDYDTRLKQLESATGSIVSAHGGLYAIRRSLYRPVPDPAVTDDFAISTGVIEQGYRLVFEPDAVGSEFAVGQARREFGRRVRLMTRGLRGVLLRRRLLNPFRFGFYSVVLFSHKVLRRLAPVPLVALAAASAWLAPSHWLYATAAAGQGAFYALGLAGFALRGAAVGRLKPLYVPFYFCMANVACALAVAQLLAGRRIELWQPQRHPAAAHPKPAGA
jgi:cellulose synthase/poly-beta-1,6-N-acetylglucosamine synthase-like glycosyltransferase